MSAGTACIIAATLGVQGNRAWQQEARSPPVRAVFDLRPSIDCLHALRSLLYSPLKLVENATVWADVTYNSTAGIINDHCESDLIFESILAGG